MSKFGRILGEIAAGSSSIYRIVFTGLLIWELIKFKTGKRHEKIRPAGPAVRNR